MTEEIVPPKRCSKCHEEKPATLEFFHKHRDSLTARCKSCIRDYQQSNKAQISAYNRERTLRTTAQRQARYQANKASILEKQREYYQRNFDKIAERKREYQQRNKAYFAAYASVWREENRDTLLLKKSEYRQKNIIRLRQLHSQRYQQHRQEYLAAAKRRKTRKRGLPCNWTAELWQRCLDYWNNCCAICSCALTKTHADHWIPLNYKGADNPGTVPANMLCMCSDCNLNKGKKLPERWLTKRFGQDKAAEISQRIHAYFDWIKAQS